MQRMPSKHYKSKPAGFMRLFRVNQLGRRHKRGVNYGRKKEENT